MTIKRETVETENVQHNVRLNQLQYVEIEYLKNEKPVIMDQKIEKINNVQKNVHYIIQDIQIVEIELLIAMKTVEIVLKMLDYVSDLVEMVFLKLLKNVTIDQIIMEKIIFVTKIVETSILTNFVEMVIQMKMNEKNVIIENKIELTDNVV